MEEILPFQSLSQMQLIDTHAHIYDSVFHGQSPDVYARFRQAGGCYVVMPNIDFASIQPMLDLHQIYPHSTGMLLGLHPCYVRENYAQQLAQIFAYLDLYQFIGIGEIGLDQIRNSELASAQEAAFRVQLELALQHKLPISIHARASTRECVRIVKEYPELRGVFHCFSDDYACAKEIVDMGFYLGIGGIISFKKAAELRDVVGKIGANHLVLETDSPYLAPVPKRGKTNEPAYLSYILEVLGIVLKQDLPSLAQITTQNSRQLFRLSLGGNNPK